MLILKSAWFALGTGGTDEDNTTGGTGNSGSTGGTGNSGSTGGTGNSGSTGGTGSTGDSGGGTGSTGDSGGDTQEQQPKEYYATYYFKYNSADGRWYKYKSDALAQGAISVVLFFVALGESETLTATLEPFGGWYARILSVDDVYDQTYLRYNDVAWGETTAITAEESVTMTISSPRKSLWICVQAEEKGETSGGFTEEEVQYIEDHITEHITITRT